MNCSLFIAYRYCYCTCVVSTISSPNGHSVFLKDPVFVTQFQVKCVHFLLTFCTPIGQQLLFHLNKIYNRFNEGLHLLMTCTTQNLFTNKEHLYTTLYKFLYPNHTTGGIAVTFPSVSLSFYVILSQFSATTSPSVGYSRRLIEVLKCSKFLRLSASETFRLLSVTTLA